MAEMVVTVAVTGIIAAFLGTAIYQILTVSDYGNNRNMALHDLQNAAYWFKYDGEKALTASGDSQLTLINADNSTITYSLVEKELRRISQGNYMVLARNISNLAFTINGRLITMNITSNPLARDDVNANGTYLVYLRVGG